jgi:hypothetical protein
MQATAMFPEVRALENRKSSFCSDSINLSQLNKFSIRSEIKRLIAKYPEGYEGYEKTTDFSDE